MHNPGIIKSPRPKLVNGYLKLSHSFRFSDKFGMLIIMGILIKEKIFKTGCLNHTIKIKNYTIDVILNIEL